MTKALSAAPLAVTQPVTFLQLVWASLLGYFVFSEEVDIYVIFGGGIIIAAGQLYFISRMGVVAPYQYAPCGGG